MRGSGVRQLGRAVSAAASKFQGARVANSCGVAGCYATRGVPRGFRVNPLREPGTLGGRRETHSRALGISFELLTRYASYIVANYNRSAVKTLKPKNRKLNSWLG